MAQGKIKKTGSKKKEKKVAPNRKAGKIILN
jgi:hypothetical protein